MSAFNVGKKVSAAVRILQRKRDASARATHLVGKKYPLITYEKALLSQATGGKFPSVTFIERKQMSTKTSIKRIALVAAAALTLGGFSAVSANAAATVTTGSVYWNVTNAYSGNGTATVAGSSATGYQTVGSTATVTFYETVTASTSGADIYANFGVSGVGTVTALPTPSHALVSTPGSLTAPNGTTQAYPTAASGWDAYANSTISSATLVSVAFSVYSSVAGAQTLTANIAGTNYTATINWIATSAAGISATSSKAFLYKNGQACPVATTVGNAAAAAADVTKLTSSIFYKDTASAVNVCAYTFDASGNPVTPTGSTVGFTSMGVLSGLSISGNLISATLIGDNAQKGSGTVTMFAKDAAGNTTTLTAAFTSYGNVASLTLANNLFSDIANGVGQQGYALGIDTTAGTTSPSSLDTTKYAHAISVLAKDSAGNKVPFSNWTNASNGDLAAGKLLVVSDHGNGNTATTVGQSNAYATVSMGTAADSSPTTSNSSTYGGLVVTCNYLHYEKLTITAFAYSSATGADTIASAPVTFYCSGLATAIAVTAASATADAGTTDAINVNATDTNGYPVADGTAVAFGVSNGGVFLGGSTSTTNGALYTATNLIVGSQGDNVVTALVNGATPITNTTTVSVSGGVAGTSSLSLDAANAATDAANNAYDEAQNATQAASDALAAVTALSAQVGALIATVKSLAAVVAKIKAKVKA